MKRRFLKYFFYSFCLIFFILIVFFQHDGQSFLKLSFLDVGQGDSTLINLSNQKIILIDGGPDNLVLRSLGKELPFYKKKIDAIIISHFHHDHISGLIEIFRRYKVGLLIYAKDLKQFYPNTLLLAEARKQGTEIVVLEKKLDIKLEPGCNLELTHPYEYVIDNDNDSLVAKLDCHNLTFLASGDNEGTMEIAMLEKSADISAQIFKASHHGSKTSNSKDFLSLIRPQLIVISAGANNTFKHPSPEVIKIISELGIGYKETSREGTISILADFNLD